MIACTIDSLVELGLLLVKEANFRSTILPHVPLEATEQLVERLRGVWLPMIPLCLHYTVGEVSLHVTDNHPFQKWVHI